MVADLFSHRQNVPAGLHRAGCRLMAPQATGAPLKAAGVSPPLSHCRFTPRLQVRPPSCRCAPQAAGVPPRPQVHPPSGCRCTPLSLQLQPPSGHNCTPAALSALHAHHPLALHFGPGSGSSVMSCCSWVSVPTPGVSDVCFHGLVSLPRGLQGFWGSRVPLVSPCELA